ncbi:MAG TPA: DUF4251 domain-containing protein, partial [Chitinophagaceae bacterium]|nr:DUF4251 domain-containing protein [Chitinophagaceae bacterium]
MKTNNIMRKIIVLSALLFLKFSAVFAQDEAAIKNMLQSHQYIFIAQFALPMTGRSVSLTPDQSLIISGDSVIAYLPYYGTAYQAPLNPDDGGINFTSVKFNYASSKAKKDGWDISIVPKDIWSGQKLSLHISSTGRATLQVTSFYRQPITFT